MIRALFVYGSLRDPRVRRRLLGERPGLTTGPARLYGYARVAVPHFGYPFVVPAGPHDYVDGELLLGLQPADLVVLDAYEDVDAGLYVRAEVAVEPLEEDDAASAEGQTVRPRAITAWTYLRGPGAPA